MSKLPAAAFSLWLAGTALPHAQVLDDVDNLHPAYAKSQLRPAAWQPQVAGMDILPDGRLLILEQRNPAGNPSNIPKKNGWLYIVDNPDAANPEDIRHRTLLDSLKEPVGVLYKDGRVYVSEKNELNEFSLDTAAGKAVKIRTIAKLPHDTSGGANRQEFSFGTLYKDGFFYVVGGGAVRQGGKSFDSAQSSLNESRAGAVLRIKESDGSIEALNAGLRASNGITWGPEGSIWVTDNQGSYVPSSKLTEIVAGANYGYPNKPGAFSSKAITPPSVWLVHGEIGRSPTYPHLMAAGPYAGQFLVGDMSQGGIKRVFVEKVNGAWQGAAFSFTGGLEAAIEIIQEGPNGSIYLGGLGTGDLQNWGWNGKKFALQKLTPKAGVTVMEIMAIRSRKNGMEIEFSKPVGPESEVPSAYSVQSGLMVPQSDYGAGSMDGKVNIAVKSVQLSSDRKKAFLQMDLTEKHVLVIKTLGVKSQTGEAVRCPAGWYTLNSISPSSAFDPVVTVKRPAMPLASAIKVSITGEGVRVAIPFEGDHECILMNLQGRTVSIKRGQGASDYRFGRKDFGPGIFLLDIKAAGALLRKALVL